MVRQGQEVPLWVRGQALVRLRATATSPAEVVLLAPGTELHVAPKSRKAPPAPADAHAVHADASDGGQVAAAAAAQKPREAAAVPAAQPLASSWLRIQTADDSLLVGASALLPLLEGGADGSSKQSHDRPDQCTQNQSSGDVTFGNNNGIVNSDPCSKISGSGSKHSLVCAALLQSSSWITTAVFVSESTLHRAGFVAGSPIRLSTRSNKSGISSLVVVLLVDRQVGRCGLALLSTCCIKSHSPDGFWCNHSFRIYKHCLNWWNIYHLSYLRPLVYTSC